MLARIPLRKMLKYHHRLLHLRFAPCVYSFATIGAVMSPTFYLDRLLWTYLGIFFGLQMCAYKLDELKGRHMMTKIPNNHLIATAIIGLISATLIGFYLSYLYGWHLLGILVLIAFSIISYNLEIFRGLFHSQLFFAITWGSLVVLGSYYLHSFTISLSIIFMALAVFIFAYSHDPLVAITKCWCKPTCLELKEAMEKNISSINIPCRLQTCQDRLIRDKLVDKLAWQTIKLQNPWLWLLIAISLVLWRLL